MQIHITTYVFNMFTDIVNCLLFQVSEHLWKK